MTKKNSKKRAARVLQQKHGGSYQHHLRSIGGADGDGATPEAETEGILDPASHPVFMLKQLYEAAENILHEHPEGPSFLATVLAYTLPDRSTPFVPTVPTTAMNFIHDAPPLVLRGLARIR